MHKMQLKVTKLVYYLNFAFMNIKTHFGFFFQHNLGFVSIKFWYVLHKYLILKQNLRLAQNIGRIEVILVKCCILLPCLICMSQDLLIFFIFSQEFFTHMEASQISIKGCKF